MDELSTKLNSLIVGTFNSIVKVEEEMVKSMSKYNLTIAEMHMLEQIGFIAEKCTISELAAALKVSLPTVTVAVNKLVIKNCLIKQKNPIDTRSIHISLTDLGKKINRVHAGFHKKMIADISEGLSDTEKEMLIKGIAKIQAYFDNITTRKT
jgi:DNA-binding MarR family transcriptional regulator